MDKMPNDRYFFITKTYINLETMRRLNKPQVIKEPTEEEQALYPIPFDLLDADGEIVFEGLTHTNEGYMYDLPLDVLRVKYPVTEIRYTN